MHHFGNFLAVLPPPPPPVPLHTKLNSEEILDTHVQHCLWC